MGTIIDSLNPLRELLSSLCTKGKPMRKSKYPLTTQTTHLFIVIRKNKVLPIETIKSYCEQYFIEWSFIEHKQDIEPVSQVVEGCHYHIIGKARKQRTPLSTHLNDLVRFFRFDNANGIEIDKYEDYIKGIQYLIHKNNPEKTKHEFNEVHSNIEEQELMLIMKTDTGDIISFDFIYSVCSTSKNIVEVIRSVGFKLYCKYRSGILDIWEFCSKRRGQLQAQALTDRNIKETSKKK